MNMKFEITKDSKQPQNVLQGENFKKADFGAFKYFDAYTCENKDLNLKCKGKIFLRDILNLTGSEISINYVSPGYTAPFRHVHNENEEIYIVLKGNIVLEVDSKKSELKEGSFAKVAPNGVRKIENISNEEAVFMVIQTKANSLSEFTLTDAKIV